MTAALGLIVKDVRGEAKAIRLMGPEEPARGITYLYSPRRV